MNVGGDGDGDALEHWLVGQQQQREISIWVQSRPLLSVGVSFVQIEQDRVNGVRREVGSRRVKLACFSMTEMSLLPTRLSGILRCGKLPAVPRTEARRPPSKKMTRRRRNQQRPLFQELCCVQAAPSGQQYQWYIRTCRVMLPVQIFAGQSSLGGMMIP